MTIEFISAPWDGAQFHAPLTQAEYRERSTTATRRALRELRHQIPHHRLKHENRLFRPRDLLLGLVVGFLLVVIPLLLSWFVTQRQEVVSPPISRSSVSLPTEPAMTSDCIAAGHNPLNQAQGAIDAINVSEERVEESKRSCAEPCLALKQFKTWPTSIPSSNFVNPDPPMSPLLPLPLSSTITKSFRSNNGAMQSPNTPAPIPPWHTAPLYPSQPPLPMDPTILILILLALSGFTLASAINLAVFFVSATFHSVYFTCVGLLQAIRLTPCKPIPHRSQYVHGISTVGTRSNGATHCLPPSLSNQSDATFSLQPAEDGTNPTCVQADILQLRRVLRKTTARLEKSEAHIAELSRMQQSFDSEREIAQGREAALQADVAHLQSLLSKHPIISEHAQANAVAAAAQSQAKLEGTPLLSGNLESGPTPPDVMFWSLGKGIDGGEVSGGPAGQHALNAVLGSQEFGPQLERSIFERDRIEELHIPRGLASEASPAANGRSCSGATNAGFRDANGLAKPGGLVPSAHDSSQKHQELPFAPQPQSRSVLNLSSSAAVPPAQPNLRPGCSASLKTAPPRLSPLLPDAKSPRVPSAVLARYGILPPTRGAHISSNKPPANCSSTPPPAHPPRTSRPAAQPPGPSPRLQTPRLQTPRSPDLSPAAAMHSHAMLSPHSASLHSRGPLMVPPAAVSFPACSAGGSALHHGNSRLHHPCAPQATTPRSSSGVSGSSRSAPSVDCQAVLPQTPRNARFHATEVGALDLKSDSHLTAASFRSNNAGRTCMDEPHRTSPLPLQVPPSGSVQQPLPSQVAQNIPEATGLSDSPRGQPQLLFGAGAEKHSQVSGSCSGGSHPHFAVSEAVAVSTTARFLSQRGVMFAPHEAAATSQTPKSGFAVL